MPVLSQMAQDFLAIPATSAPSESMFSQASDIITKKRNRLGADTVNMLMCLRSWGVPQFAEQTDVEPKESQNSSEVLLEDDDSDIYM